MSLNDTTNLVPRRSSSYANRVFIFASILFGVFLIIKIVLSGFSLSNFEDTILSVFAALGITLFIIRDRYLGSQLKSLENKYLSIITTHKQRIESIYSSHSICCAEIDIITLELLRASPVFYDLCSIEQNSDTKGLNFNALLKIDSDILHTFFEQLKNESGESVTKVNAIGSSEISLRLIISGRILADGHSVELIIFNSPSEIVDSDERQLMVAEIDRYSQGVISRESRILALKSEVNDLLAESGQVTRYKVDSKSSDRDNEVPLDD
ncbi:MAG TPA: hypothetical protein DD622_04905 [Opitutae bacterium]|nr:hypothetical protein [Opitutae bacterium]